MDAPWIDDKVKKSLEGTPYAASKLTKLEGGFVNFTYLAELTTPLENGTTRVIIKHGEDFTAFKPDYKISFDRCLMETDLLNRLTEEPIQGLTQPSGGTASFSVRTPELYHYDEENVNQVSEVMPSAIDLKNYARQRLGSPTPASLKSPCQEVGRALGSWLRGFHTWAAGQEELHRITATRDAPSRIVTHMIYFEWITDRLKEYPDELGDLNEALLEVKAMADRERQAEERFQIVHGDFSPGNTLLPNEPFIGESKTPLFVIDWELAQLGIPAVDLGEMLGDLLGLWRYQQIDGGLWMMQGFIDGYQEKSEATVFRTAIQIGARLLCHSLSLPDWGNDEKVKREVVRLGGELMVRAWKKDRAWFDGGELAFLFSGVTA